MKRLLFFLMASIFAMQGFSQATLNEGFEGTTFPPDDWTKVTTQGTVSWERYTSSSPRGTASASVNYASPNHTNYLITPKLIVSSDQDSISFWVKCDYYYSGTTLNVLASTTNSDIASFSTTSLLTLADAAITETWSRKTIPLTSFIGQEIYIAFQVVDVFGMRIMLDDVTGPELFVPTCPKPTALITSNPTTSGVDLAWTDATGSAWNIQYMLASETDWTNATLITGATNPYTFTTLNPASTYKTRVQTDCGSEQSEWSSVKTFITSCAPLTTLPYVENFDTYGTGTTIMPLCWVRNASAANRPYVTSGGRTSNCLYFYAGVATDYTIAAMTPIDDAIPVSGLMARFYYKSSNTTDKLIVGVMTDPTDITTFDSVTTIIAPTTSTWAEYDVNFSSYAGIGQNIAFKLMPIGSTNAYAYIDDLSVNYIPTCLRPAVPTATNVTATTAELGWTDAIGSAWTIQYMLASETEWANATEIVGVSSTSYSLMGINPASNYKFRVKTLCGAEESEWSLIKNFTTLCVSIDTFPWAEGFESILAANTLPPCWSATNFGSKTGTQITNYNSYNRNARTGTGAAWFRYGANDSFKSPAFQFTENTFYDFSFWYVTDGLGGWTSLKAELYNAVTNTLIGTIGTEVTLPPNTSYQLYSSTFTVPDETASYYIAIKCVATSSPWYLTIDDISIQLTPDCPDVYGLTVQAGSTTSVSVNWTDEADLGDGYVLAYASNVTGTFDPATATTIAIPTGTTLPYIIPGFNPGDSVWVSIQRGCLGNWATPVKVNLPEFVTQLPLIANFEDSLSDNIWTLTNGTQTNIWYIGAPGANDSDLTDAIVERGLYISSDLGLTATYNTSSTTVSFASTLVEFDNSPSFQLSFDWLNNGESSYDYINVYLLPIGETLTPGVLPNATYKLNTTVLSNKTTFQTFTKAFDASYSNTVKQLVFAWRNDGSGGANPPAKIDNISLAALTCGMPYALVMDSASYNGTDVHLRWTEPQGSTNWVIEYQQSGSAIWNQAAANSNPFTLTGLNPGTPYQARVRTICNSGDTSAISNVISFQTLCIPLSVPTLVEEFLTAVPPNTCWTKLSGLLPATGNASLATTTSGWFWDSNVTPHNAKVNIYYTSCNYWLVSPSIDLGDGTSTSQIEFDLFYTDYYSAAPHELGGTDDRFAVVVSLDNGLTWNATNATIWSNAVGATRVLENVTNVPTHIIIPLVDLVTDLPYSGIVKIGFYGESTASNTYNDLHIDNFEVRPYSTCQRPTSVIASNVTSTDATIHFTENGASTAWEYVYGDASTMTDPTTGTPISITEDSIQLTGLSPQTQYNVWVRSACTDGNSDWSDLCSFVTEALPASIPYTHGFEDATENLGWRSLSNGGNKWAIGTAAGNGATATGTKANYISNDNGLSYAMTSGYIYSYTYRDIDFGTDAASFGLTFDWKAQGDLSSYDNSLYAGLAVYLRDPSEPINTSGLPVNPNDNLGLFYNGSTWQSAQVAIDNVSGVKRLMFVYFDQYSNYAPPGAIDNISITEQTCPRPYDVIVSGQTTTTADVAWTHPGADSYIVSYRENTAGSTLIHEAAMTSPHTIQGLTLGTSYLVAVRAICSGDTTIYSETVVFTTPCADGAISSFPWTEGFELGLNCWTLTASGTAANSFWRTQTAGTSPTCAPHGGTNMAQFNSYSSPNTSGTWTTMVSPALDFTTDMQVSFWMYRDANTYYTSPLERVSLYVASSQSLTDSVLLGEIARSMTVAPVETAEGWYQYSFLVPTGTLGTRYIALKATSNYGNNIYVDDVTVESLGIPCAPPTNIVVAPTNVSATVTWTAGDVETSWEVRLGLTGTPETASITSHPLAGLTPSTQYTVYVRANCGFGYSPWIPTQFTTTDVPTPPTVTTAVPTTMISQTTAVFNGTYVQTTDAILTKGFEYKAASAATWTNEVVTDGTTPFTFSPTGLVANTAYEVKAYVTTATFNTTYGNTVAFTTLAIVPPTVTTDSVKVLSETSATFYGKITQNTESIEARGFEYKLSSQAWADAINISATGVTEISATPTTLTLGSYNVRAYARTLAGTEYGQVLTFITTGLDGIDGKEISIMMYPNPATSQTNLIVNGINGETKIILSDVQGRVLNTINAKPVSGTIEQTIDLNNLAKGVYYIRIQNSDINRTQKLIVK